MTNRLYIRLNKNTCEFDENTFTWKFKLPDNFTYSRSLDKKIIVLNFMYFIRTSHVTSNKYGNVEFTTLHSPTLCDGNYNQDYYICTLCYNYNTVCKTYPIRSQPQYIEFYFKDSLDKIIESFSYRDINEDNVVYQVEECFNIDLELIY